MVTIQGREIKNLCTLCGIKYGKNKKPILSLGTLVGNCDICAVLVNPDMPQTLRPLEAYQGLNKIDTADLIDKVQE